MSRVEFESWVAFYELHPFDDLHRYHRPAAMVASSLGGGSITDRLAWLAPEPAAPDYLDPEQYSDADRRTLDAFGLKPIKRKKTR